MARRKCAYKDCDTQLLYNFSGHKGGLYCNKHKEDGMINVVSIKCNVENCNTRASFSFYHQNAIRCSKHKERFMIRINRNPKCKICNVEKAFYNSNDGEPKSDIPIRCENCKEEGDVNVTELR